MHTVTGKLNKSAKPFQTQNGTGFSISLGEKVYNRETKQSEWTNYRMVLFAKDKQVDFYTNNLVEGAIVSVSGDALQIKQWEDKTYLEMSGCKLGYINNPGDAPRQQAPQQQQGFQPQQPVQQGSFNRNQPQQAPQSSGFDDFDDEIPY